MLKLDQEQQKYQDYVQNNLLNLDSLIIHMHQKMNILNYQNANIKNYLKKNVEKWDTKKKVLIELVYSIYVQE